MAAIVKSLWSNLQCLHSTSRLLDVSVPPVFKHLAGDIKVTYDVLVVVTRLTIAQARIRIFLMDINLIIICFYASCARLSQRRVFTLPDKVACWQTAQEVSDAIRMCTHRSIMIIHVA